MMASYLFTPVALTLGTADNNTTLSVTLSKTTIINVTLTSAIALAGLAAVGGNVDGMVVCLSNITATNLGLGLTDQSGLAIAVNRFRHTSSSGLTLAQYDAGWYRYSSAAARWQEIARLT